LTAKHPNTWHADNLSHMPLLLLPLQVAGVDFEDIAMAAMR
jgi:hypothetical protein